jgi:hypothetical protein
MHQKQVNQRQACTVCVCMRDQQHCALPRVSKDFSHTVLELNAYMSAQMVHRHTLVLAQLKLWFSTSGKKIRS